MTTVQRWEQEERLPVHRLPHGKKGSVFAFKSEVDAWRIAREQSALPLAKTAVDTQIGAAARWLLAGRTGPNRTWVLGAVALTAVSLAALGLLRAWAHRAKSSAGSATTPAFPRPLANDAGHESYPSLSPDGNEVVYTWARDGARGLYVKAVDEGSSRPLLIGEGMPFGGPGYAKWSPKGNLIAFLRHEDSSDPDTRTLYVISPSGGTPRRLTTVSGIGLAWHPQGKEIGFVDRTAGTAPKSIHLISLETGARRRLTSPPPATYGDLWCAFSPDGRRLAIARFATVYEADVYVTSIVDGRTEGVERLTYDGWPIEGLDWTPDGQSILFGSTRGLWMVSSLGRERPHRVLVAGAEAAARHPTISRATAGAPVRLAYQYDLRDVNIWRWSQTPAGLGTFSKVVGSTWWEDHPAFSPDGRLVAFASNRTGVNEIWIADVDGSAVRQLTYQAGTQAISPQWSPDGQRLAFSATVAGNRDVYVIRADGSASTRLTYEPSAEGNPSWSRDGRSVYFRSDRAGVGQIWKAPIDGGQAFRVTDGQASQAFESPDGTLLYFVRSIDVPGVWSVPADGGPETFVVGDARESYWGVARDGIYFLVPARAPASKARTVDFYSFGSKTVTTVATLTPDDPVPIKGFAVSNDGRSALWCRVDRSVSDLMLIDPWTP